MQNSRKLAGHAVFFSRFFLRSTNLLRLLPLHFDQVSLVWLQPISRYGGDYAKRIFEIMSSYESIGVPKFCMFFPFKSKGMTSFNATYRARYRYCDITIYWLRVSLFLKIIRIFVPRQHVFAFVYSNAACFCLRIHQKATI